MAYDHTRGDGKGPLKYAVGCFGYYILFWDVNLSAAHRVRESRFKEGSVAPTRALIPDLGQQWDEPDLVYYIRGCDGDAALNIPFDLLRENETEYLICPKEPGALYPPPLSHGQWQGIWVGNAEVQERFQQLRDYQAGERKLPPFAVSTVLRD